MHIFTSAAEIQYRALVGAGNNFELNWVRLEAISACRYGLPADYVSCVEATKHPAVDPLLLPSLLFLPRYSFFNLEAAARALGLFLWSGLLASYDSKHAHQIFHRLILFFKNQTKGIFRQQRRGARK